MIIPDGTIAILGFAREGRSTYEFLLQHGKDPEQIAIFDEKTTIADLPECVQKHLGPLDAYSSQELELLASYDHIFLAPGITLHMLAQKIGNKDLFEKLHPKLTSQTQYFFDHFKGKVIGITGTKGKSTISTLAYLMLEQAGKNVQLVGNVGKPVLQEIDRDHPPEIVVYELSSFMLERIEHVSLDIGVLNTLYPAHTKEHGGYDAYLAAKIKLLGISDHTLIGAQAAEVIQRSGELELSATHKTYLYGKTGKRTFHDGRFYEDDQKLFNDSEMLLLGEHNRHNVCALIGICRLLSIDLEHLQTVLHSFSGLEHRIEYVGIFNGIKRYNDAIATTPQATMAAIKTFKTQLDTIFLGGIEGEYDFSGVADLLKKYRVKNIILFPDTGTRIKTLLDPDLHTLFETRSMQEAVTFAATYTQPGKVALLSCGSPSFSLRTNYQEKGQQFKEAVREIE